MDENVCTNYLWSTAKVCLLYPLVALVIIIIAYMGFSENIADRNIYITMISIAASIGSMYFTYRRFVAVANDCSTYPYPKSDPTPDAPTPDADSV